MRKILTASLIGLLATVFLSSCSSGSNDNLRVTPDFNQPVWNMPRISANHPTYKTIVINQPIAVVRKTIRQTAQREGFDEFRDFSSSIAVRKVAVYGNDPVYKEFKNLSPGKQAGVVLVGVLLVGATMGRIDLSPTGGQDFSQPKQIKAVVGIAEFNSIDKNTTELKINFNRVFYNWDNGYDKSTGLFHLSWDYRAQRVEEINDPKIYELAFRRLQR
jgi:hypothetical protein